MDSLRWRLCPDEQQTFELVHEDDPVVRLRIEQARSVFGSGYGIGAHAAAGGNGWRFKHTHLLGLTHQRVHVTDDGGRRDLALFKVRTFGSGVLHFPDGRRFHYGSPGFISDDRVWKDTNGLQLMRLLTGRSEGMRRGAGIEAEAGARSLPEFPLLAALGCYLYVMRKAQEAQAARDLDVKTGSWWERLLLD